MGGHDGQPIPKLIRHLDKLVGHFHKLLVQTQLLQYSAYTRVGQEATITKCLHMHTCTLNYSHMASKFS